MRTKILVLVSIFSASLFAALPESAAAAPLVGPSVGSADALQAEGNRLFNRKQYAQAAARFLAATRADPTALPAYLSLARAELNAKRLAESCSAYRAYLRSAPEGSERSKAQSELELCERRLNAAKVKDDSAREFVELKAAFYAALEQKLILGEEGAGQALRNLVERGYLGVDLAEIAAKLHAEAIRGGEEIHAQALSHEQVSLQRLLDGREFFDLAADVGPEPEARKAKAEFLAGRAALEVAAAKKVASESVTGKKDPFMAESIAAVLEAVEHFTQASSADPKQGEYKFFRALALYRRGDVDGALASLKRDLPEDPRTTIFAAVQAIVASPEKGAAEMERVLFSTRYVEAK